MATTASAAAARLPAHKGLHGETPLLPLMSAAVVFICSTRQVNRLKDGPDYDSECSATRSSSPPPPLTATSTAMHLLTARERVGLLPHVVSNVSAFVDVACAPRWTIPKACKHGHLAMLPRLASQEPADMNEHYRAHLFSKGLIHAAGRGDLPMVQWLCCEYCPSGFAWKGMEEAAVVGQLSVLQWLVARYDYMQWDEGLLTSVAANGHLEVLQWIYEQPAHASCPAYAVNGTIDHDKLPVRKWLLERYPDYAEKCGTEIKDAILSGDIERVQRLVDLGLEFDFCSNNFMSPAVQSGSLEMVQWVYRLAFMLDPDNAAELVRNPESTHLVYAAEQGYLDIVKWLYEHDFKDDMTHVVATAAAGGHLDVVQWFHESDAGGFSVNVMDQAASRGHLEVVKWLHDHRTEGCTTIAMDRAASCGRLEIVKWLHENRTEGCTTAAMDEAAYDHLETVRWLHENRSEGCTTRAMDNAAGGGHLEIVKWLHEHRTEGCTTAAINRAAYNGHFEVLLWLHANHIEGCTTETTQYAILREQYEVLQWLADAYPDVVIPGDPSLLRGIRAGAKVLLARIESTRAAR